MPIFRIHNEANFVVGTARSVEHAIDCLVRQQMLTQSPLSMQIHEYGYSYTSSRAPLRGVYVIDEFCRTRSLYRLSARPAVESIECLDLDYSWSTDSVDD